MEKSPERRSSDEDVKIGSKDIDAENCLRQEIREFEEFKEKRRAKARKNFAGGLLFCIILGGILSPFAPFYVVFFAALLFTSVLQLPDLIDSFRK